ncbi:MAG TPA: cytochrome P450 [Acidimicrobiia bacterium]|jgi:cytochrome P450|nr:cytochrome P450 [Acidimicrobiia bacterium]
MQGDTTVEYNPFARDTQTNPFPVYRWLRDEAPVYHNAEVGFYALSRFDDVLQAHLDPATFVSSHGVTIEGYDQGQDLLITSDAPRHNWHRKLVSRLFTPRAIADLEPKVRAIAAEVLDRARDRGEIDIVAEFSTHLPMMVIAEMLGLPPETRADLRRTSDRILDRSEADELGNTTDDSQLAMIEMMTLLTEIVDDTSKHLGDDIASILLSARVTDDDGNEVALTHAQVASRLLEMTIAGHETTAKLIANGVVALTWYPDQRAELAAEPSLIPNAVEEMLRWDPPSHYQGRWVERDVTLHGVTIPADSRVILLTGAANHDERAFADPEYFDIHREIERHVGFGFGIHLCIGAALARLETRIAFEELLARYPNYEVRQPMVRAYSSNVRGLSNLPLALEPAA